MYFYMHYFSIFTTITCTFFIFTSYYLNGGSDQMMKLQGDTPKWN